MHVGKKSQKREKSVMSVSLYGNVVFVVIELVMAIATGSQAVLLDAVYDGVEFFMLLPSVFRKIHSSHFDICSCKHYLL